MSQRDRPAPHGRPAALRPADVPAGPGSPAAWDDLYDRLPPDRRARLIERAAATGVIPADDLPAPAAARHLLQRLLAGDGFGDLPPLDDSDPPRLSAELDPQQRAAVALALRTPDVALVQGLPGTGKSRVVAEAVALAAGRGERVLLVAPGPAALDRVLELLADRPGVCPLRCVGKDEAEADLPPASAACTFAAHARRLTDQAREHAQAQVAAAVEACRRRDAEAAVYDHLLDLAEQHHRLQARRAELPALRDGVAAAVERLLAEPTDADRDHAAAVARLDADWAARRADADRARQAVRDIEPSLAELRPLAAAKAGGRWWTPAWWRARSAGDVAARLAEAEAKHRQAQADAAAAEREVERLTRARAELVAEHGRRRDERRRTELDRRRAELDDQAAAVERELALVADKWQQAVQQLPADGPKPESLTTDAAAAARDAWGKHRDADRRQLDFARAWADGLEPLAEALPGRLLEAVNLVAATPAALAADRHFGDGRRGPFDLVVVEEAHAVPDADLLAAARRGRRWVLIGEPDTLRPSPSASEGRHLAGARARTDPSHTRGFARLWQLLHCDPWGRDGERVVCRLRPVPPGRRLDREPVADRPDVELCIHTPPGGVPELAEVVFPAGTPIARATEYVFKELGELPAVGGVDPRWEDAPDRLAARWRDGPSAAAADLGGGVRAVLADGGIPAAVEFDRAAGWDRERAAAWVRQHAVGHGPGRAVRLETPHRMAPGLAEVVGDLLGVSAFLPSPGRPASGYPAGEGPGVRVGSVDVSRSAADRETQATAALTPNPSPAKPGEGGTVEFVPVPGVGGNGRNGHAAGHRLPPDLRGAGLETDLADGRQRGRLPPDLDDLPECGVVNVAEARAVVRVLEDLAAEPGPVAVLALSAAQAELIRRLARAAGRVPADLVVGTPPVLRQREAGTVVVSLVRSHTHRAVPYGEEPDWLPLALARGRRRLILVGDPGTLARRAQWDGPLDHLDGAAARRERDLVHHLVRYLHGRGRFARAFRLCPGTPP